MKSSTLPVPLNDRAVAVVDGAPLPALFAPDAHAARRTIEFFTAHISNDNTRYAYARAAAEFSSWCDRNRIAHLHHVEPVHVAAYVKQLQMQGLAAPSVKQRLSAIRQLFDWLIVGQVMPHNPASAVRGPKHVVKKGKTRVLTAEEARILLDRIPTVEPKTRNVDAGVVPPEDDTAEETQPCLIGLRDRALIALMAFTFARVTAAAEMRVEDVYVQGRRTWARLHEKGGKLHDMPCNHNLENYLHAYIDAAGLEAAPRSFLFRSARGRSGMLSNRGMHRVDIYQMIQRRAEAAGIRTKIGCHTFRATGITEYLKNGGKLEIAQQMANHESARTTGLYDRRSDLVSLDEVERILI